MEKRYGSIQLEDIKEFYTRIIELRSRHIVEVVKDDSLNDNEKLQKIEIRLDEESAYLNAVMNEMKDNYDIDVENLYHRANENLYSYK